MKLFTTLEYLEIENPQPGESYRPEILTDADNAKELGGMFGLLSPGNQVPYHYHQNRESVIVVISGEAIEVIEGEEMVIKEGDIIFIPSGHKHMTINRSDQDSRYLEFYTRPPLHADFVAAE
ncbi:MAG: cupin domain-containing protein [Desulfofustis sp.]|nr:cupin domain-containing protein [Desulfofustis sp.]